MNQSFLSGALLLFFLILISSSHSSARFMENKHEKEEIEELSQITGVEDIEMMKQLMGVKACESGDDECLQRRAISEAHLDYIYTQQQKP